MIVLVDNFDSFTYNLYQQLSLFDEVTVLRNNVASVDAVSELKPSRIVISPGPGRPDSAGYSKQLIEHFSAKEVPLLGVCLGHQAIVEVFGGKVVLADQAIHGKTTSVYHNAEGLYKSMPMPFKAGRYHSLIAERSSLPSCLIIDAENTEGVIMGVHHETLPLFGFQYHPESILTPAGNRLVENFVKV